MSIGKLVLSLFVVVLLAAGGGLWYLFSNLNSLVQDAVETIGSDTLHTQVKLNKVNIELVDGVGELSGFSIANYPGFTQSNFLTFDRVKIDIDPSTVTDDVIVVDELTIEGVRIVAEQLGNTTNLQTLLDKLPASESSNEQESSSSEILLAVKKLNFLNSDLTLATEKYGTHSLQLPNIERRNLGTVENGLTPEQLADAIARPLINSAKTSVEKGVANLVRGEVDAKLEEEKERLKEKLDDKFGEGTSDKLRDLKKLF